MFSCHLSSPILPPAGRTRRWMTRISSWPWCADSGGCCTLGWPHPNSESDKKIRARYFLPLYDPYKWIPKGILILTTRRPLPRLKFFGFFAPHVGLQTSTAYCSQLNCHEFWKAFSDFQWSICNISELSMDPMRTRLPVEAWEQYSVFNIHIVRSM